MMGNLNLRTAMIGGYKKKDVMHCLEKIQAEFADFQEKMEAKLLAAQTEYQNLEVKYQQLIEENQKLQAKCDMFDKNRQAIIQLELDANTRAKEKLESATSEAEQVILAAQTEGEQVVCAARVEAEQLICAANAEAAASRAQYIRNTKQDLAEIQTVQAQLDELVATISTKNKVVQQRMLALEDILEGK